MKKMYWKLRTMLLAVCMVVCMLPLVGLTVQAEETETIIPNLIPGADWYAYPDETLTMDRAVLQTYINEHPELNGVGITVHWQKAPWVEAYGTWKDIEGKTADSLLLTSDMIGYYVRIRLECSNGQNYYSKHKIVSLSEPKKLEWDGCIARWEAVNYVEYYRVSLYRNGVFVGWSEDIYDETFYDCKEDMMLMGDGTYTFDIEVYGRSTHFKLMGTSEMSPELNYRIPEITRLKNPTNIRLDENGYLWWDPVENARKYRATVSKNGQYIDEVYSDDAENCADMTWDLPSSGWSEFDFSVQAIYSFSPDTYNSDIVTTTGKKFRRLSEVEGLSWDGYTAKWNAVPGADAYKIELSGNGLYLKEELSADTKLDCSTILKKKGPGKYCFRVWALSWENPEACSRQSDWSDSVEWTEDTVSAGPLGKVTGLTWDGYIAKWNPVKNAAYYVCTLYQGSMDEHGKVIYDGKTCVDWSEKIIHRYMKAYYRFEVYAVGYDGQKTEVVESEEKWFDGTTFNISVTDGKARACTGKMMNAAAEGTEITLTADTAPKGKKFGKWVVVSGNVKLANVNAATTTFKMPKENVVLKAMYIHKHEGILVPLQKATLAADGSKAYYRCSCGRKYLDVNCTKEITGDINVWKRIPYPKTIKLSAKSYKYDGKAKKPTVKVVGSDGKTTDTAVYSVKYARGRKDVGVYTVRIVFKGNYSGVKVLTFSINPTKTKLQSVTPIRKGLVAKWEKVPNRMGTKRITGYEIQYSTSKRFKDAVTKKIKGYKNIGVKIRRLKPKKTYYVRVRTYMKVNGQYCYSPWTKKMPVRTLK